MSEDIETVVVRRVMAGEFDLPSLPPVAARCLALLDAPEVSLRDVAALVESDQSVAARLLRLANSAAFPGLQRAVTVFGCLTRIGTNELRTFLVETAAKHLIESRDPIVCRICRGVWEHSLAVAMLARDLARARAARVADAAYLAGLLHDVGKPVVITMLVDAERRLTAERVDTFIPPLTWLKLVSQAHRSAGMALAHRWGLPESVSACIAQCAVYDREHVLSMRNFVTLGNALTKVDGCYLGMLDAQQATELVDTGRDLLRVDHEELGALLASLRDKVQARLS